MRPSFARRLGRTSALWLCAAFVVEGCGPDRGAGARCESDGGCAAGLACLEGLCAPPFDDPGGEPFGEPGPVRVFAVGLHLTMDDVESQESFRAAVRAAVDEQVAPSLPEDRPALLVFPEDVGLFASLIGSRGSAARQASTTAVAFLELATSYGAAAGHYSGRAARSLGPGGVVAISVTDTLWRSLETFAELAREHGVWVAVGYNVADAERTEDPALVDTLADEDAEDRTFAWLAVGDDVHNQSLVFDPSGALVGRDRKEYLVPAEESDLNLVHGSPGGLRARWTPFGPIASVISKDAWMPDVLGRLALDGAALMLQLEAFSGWGVVHDEHGAWPADVVMESGWGHVMREPGFRVNVLPCLSANLFDMAFDCQSAILVDPLLWESRGAFIGRDPDAGLARVAPWVAEDDGVGTLEERRARLIEVGERLLPGSGHPEENGYVAGTVWMDVDLGLAWPVVDEQALAPSDAGAQRRPAVAALDDGTVLVLWEDDRGGLPRLYGTRVPPGGEPGEVRVRVPTEGAARAPRLAARGQEVHLVWQEGVEGGLWAVRHARSADGGRSFPSPTTLGGGSGATSAYAPRVALGGGRTVHVVWVDDSEGALRVRHSRSPDGGRTFDEAHGFEGPFAGPYDPRQNRWDATVAARDEVVVVAWADFRAYRWEIHGAASLDGGRSFGEATRLDDADVPWETIHSDPTGILLEDGAWILAWTDLRVRRPDYDVRVRRLDPADLSNAPPSLALATTDDAGRPQFAPTMVARGTEVVVAWQDFRTDRNEVRFTRSTDGGASFEPDEPLEGASLERSHSTAPALVARESGDLALAHECTATGALRVRLAAVPDR